MNTTDEGLSFSFHKNYKLGPTYPLLAIFSLRELHQTSPSALRAETSSRYQSDPPENQIWHTDEAGASLACYQSTLISGTPFLANCISLRLGEVQMKFYERSLQALLSPAPSGFAARSRVLARLHSLAQIGELACRLNFMKNSFSYSGAVLWNSLPCDMREAKSLSQKRLAYLNFWFFKYCVHGIHEKQVLVRLVADSLAYCLG